jgi:hypothetical protein
MGTSSYSLYENKVVIRLRDRIADTSERLLSTSIFRDVLTQYLARLTRQRSKLLNIFPNKRFDEQQIDRLVACMQYLTKLPAELVPRLVDGSEPFFKDSILLNDFIEGLYNYWRSLHRMIICDSIGDRFDKRPYRTFNDTVEKLMHVVRSTYRDIQENITGNHPRVYRQVTAGAEVAAIALPRDINYPSDTYKKLNDISIIRQVLIYPPMIFNTPINKRTGEFTRVMTNPLDKINVNEDEWICYPAKVGPLVILIYFNLQYFELGFSMSNLFDLADDKDLKRKPDAIYLYGVPTDEPVQPGVSETIFYDDEENDILVGTVPFRDQYAYFGYLKKMILTLHNIKMMKRRRLPFHGAMFNLTLRDHDPLTVLLMGDTGAGKSETLEALRMIGQDDVEDLIIIADDMGSIEIDAKGRAIGYGTETGAFVRLDDLQPGYAFGQIDRTIIMNPAQVNARVVLPVTKQEEIVKGYPIDVILYANNYDEVDEQHPIIERFTDVEKALETFRNGAVMSKGTTTTTGLVHTYFANIFGPVQYKEVHEELAKEYFTAYFNQNLYVGQMRTRLGLAGVEREGPEASAKALLELLKNFSNE